MPIPVAETPPEGLDAYWVGVWRHVLKTLKAQDSWAWELKPLLDEYVRSLIAADVFRNEGEDTKWDRASKRASALADQLALTPRGRKAAGIGIFNADEPEDPFAALDESDELAKRRSQTA